MNGSFAAPCDRYDAAVERSPRASAARYERTSDEAVSSAVATAGVAGIGVAGSAVLRTGVSVGFRTGGATAARAAVGDGEASGLGVAVAAATTRGFGGFADGRIVGVGLGDGAGRGELVAGGVAVCIGVTTGAAVIAGDGNAAIAVVSVLCVLPPKK